MDEFIDDAIARCRRYDSIKTYRILNYEESEYVTRADIKVLYEKQSGQCTYCQVPLRIDNSCMRMSIDRIINKYAHVKPNCQLSCIRCNLSKGCTSDSVYRKNIENWCQNIIDSLM